MHFRQFDLTKMASKLTDLKIKNHLTRTLIPDKEILGDPMKAPIEVPKASIIPRQVHHAHYSFTKPQEAPDAKLLSFNKQMMDSLELDSDSIFANHDANKEFVDILSGNSCFPNSHPWSLAYGGHQFGSWAGQLGDGRAISLAQVEVKGQLWELQLKGAGLTPYSRFADGYAVLRSSIREYLAAEAMHSLNVPTSRSLSIINSTRAVQRETIENSAIVCRVAPSWIRFGSFELFYSRGDTESLKLLADYCIEYHFQHLLQTPMGNDRTEVYYSFLQDVVDRTAEMIAHWQSVGFCHGVMNTDNFSVLGLTIDYGPYQFLNEYDPHYICNHSDETGRYAFSEQPTVALWNLIRLASALSPLMKTDESPEAIKTVQERLNLILKSFNRTLSTKYHSLLCQKLGYVDFGTETFKVTDELIINVIQPLLVLMHEAKLDYTRFFRYLSNLSLEPKTFTEDMVLEWQKCSYLSKEELEKVDADSETGTSLTTQMSIWYISYRQSQQHIDPILRRKGMLQANPRYTLRNHIVQHVIDEVEAGNEDILNQYLKVLQAPFDDGTVEEIKLFDQMVPTHLSQLKCSCSS
ncbi:hypothetical protein BC833DRAFT_580362 [Globomyces pollinis-pini]|nr:hypothetical protein BC833DRAFT_580362 [Globomyces pollinis-pini]